MEDRQSLRSDFRHASLSSLPGVSLASSAALPDKNHPRKSLSAAHCNSASGKRKRKNGPAGGTVRKKLTITNRIIRRKKRITHCRAAHGLSMCTNKRDINSEFRIMQSRLPSGIASKSTSIEKSYEKTLHIVFFLLTFLIFRYILVRHAEIIGLCPAACVPAAKVSFPLCGAAFAKQK